MSVQCVEQLVFQLEAEVYFNVGKAQRSLISFTYAAPSQIKRKHRLLAERSTIVL